MKLGNSFKGTHLVSSGASTSVRPKWLEHAWRWYSDIVIVSFPSFVTQKVTVTSRHPGCSMKMRRIHYWMNQSCPGGFIDLIAQLGRKDSR